MPRAPVIFYGREGYVQTIVASIVESHASDRSARLAILGPGGMGKTPVAAAVVNHGDISSLFVRNRHWIPCDETPSISLLLEALAHSLCVPRKTNDRLDDILTHLRTLQSSRLIILDNLEAIWDLESSHLECEKLLALLCGFPTITLLITMRGTSRPAGVRWGDIPVIEPLSLDAARQHIHHH
jgi:hypothetical protein